MGVRTRREFLTQVGQGMLVVSVGSTLAVEMGLARADGKLGATLKADGSGFVASYAKKPDVKAALALGTLNAESVIQQVGAKAGILRKWPPATILKPYGGTNPATSSTPWNEEQLN